MKKIRCFHFDFIRFTPLHHRRTSNFFSPLADASGEIRTNSARFDLLSGTEAKKHSNRIENI